MKRELKVNHHHSLFSTSSSSSPYPYEEGTESIAVEFATLEEAKVAAHIPMKRELKGLMSQRVSGR